MTDSQSLLAEYVRNGSESSFRELVARYLGLVYSTALRLVGGDTHLAEDVAQTVFIDLARKARGLSSGVMLGGWLHRRAYNVAAPMMRARRRRQSREREAVHINALQSDPGADLAQVEPLLDEAITQLKTQERTAIILRFFEQRDFHSIGQALGSSEDAARMRVARALDKLHVLLRQRGVTLSAAALGTALATETLAAAPAGMAAGIAGTALANAAAVGLGSAFLLKLMTMTKLRAAMIGAVAVAGVTTSLVIQHQAQLRLRGENESLRQRLGQLQADNASISNRLVQPATSPSLRGDQLRELLRLRGEVGLLRRQQRELEQALGAAQSGSSAAGSQPSMGGAPRPNKPAPFQMQMVLDEPSEDSEPLTNSASGGRAETLHVQKIPLLDHTAIRSAVVTTNWQTGAPQIDVQFSEEGSQRFAEITKANIHKRLAIVLDGHLYSAPVIQSEIPGGKAQVTGAFTEEEARALAAKINDAISAR